MSPCFYVVLEKKKRKFTKPLRCGVQITLLTRTMALMSFPLNSSMLLMIFAQYSSQSEPFVIFFVDEICWVQPSEVTKVG